MRQDKLTTKFQDALGAAQSLALAHDNQVMEPLHLLAAVLADNEGSSRSLLERAGVNVQRLTRDVNEAIDRLPKVTGQGGDIQVSRDLVNLLNLTEKEAMKAGDGRSHQGRSRERHRRQSRCGKSARGSKEVHDRPDGPRP